MQQDDLLVALVAHQLSMARSISPRVAIPVEITTGLPVRATMR